MLRGRASERSSPHAGRPACPSISPPIVFGEEGEALTTVIAFGGTGGFTGCLVPPSRTRDRCCEADLVAEPSPESGAAFTGQTLACKAL